MSLKTKVCLAVRLKKMKRIDEEKNIISESVRSLFIEQTFDALLV